MQPKAFEQLMADPNVNLSLQLLRGSDHLVLSQKNAKANNFRMETSKCISVWVISCAQKYIFYVGARSRGSAPMKFFQPSPPVGPIMH